MIMTKKEKKKLDKAERKWLYDNNQAYYNHRIAVVMTTIPLLLEYFEELNEPLPEFFTTSVLKTIEQFSNSLYYKQSNENLASVGDEQVANVEELRKFFIDSLK
jgi:hypothetical protein